MAEVGSGTLQYRARPIWEQLPAGWSFREVAGVATDSLGRVYVFNRGEQPVIRFDPDGRFLDAWGQGQFRRPHGIHIGADDAVYCTDDADHTIRKFTPDGELLLQLGTSGQPSDTGATSVDYRSIRRAGGPFHYPTNAATAPNGDLYVADGYGNARVHQFSAAGEWVRSWGEPGSGPGQFHIPHGIAVDRHGEVWVADRENSRLQRFDGEGRFLDEWPGLARPCQVFVDGQDRVYVAELGYQAGMWPGTSAPGADAPGGRVSIFSRLGTLLCRWGNSDPREPGGFFAPHDLWVDSAGTIYVGEVVVSAGRGLAPAGCPVLRTFVAA